MLIWSVRRRGAGGIILVSAHASAFKKQKNDWCDCMSCFVLCPGMHHTLLTYVMPPAPLPSHRSWLNHEKGVHSVTGETFKSVTI